MMRIGFAVLMLGRRPMQWSRLHAYSAPSSSPPSSSSSSSTTAAPVTAVAVNNDQFCFNVVFAYRLTSIFLFSFSLNCKTGGADN